MDLREVSPSVSTRRHPWELARLAIVKQLIARTPAPRGILDIGCGDAFVLTELANTGGGAFHVGVDTALAAPAERGAVRIVRSIAEAALPAAVMSHVLLLDVLEHVEDDVGLLRGLLAEPCLARPCHIVITVPAHPALFTSHDTFLGHARRYTAATLRAALTAGGLTIEDEGSMFTSLLVPRVLERVAETVRPRTRTQTGLTEWRRGERVTRAIDRVLQTDFLIADTLRKRGVPVPGLSLYAVCRVS